MVKRVSRPLAARSWASRGRTAITGVSPSASAKWSKSKRYSCGRHSCRWFYTWHHCNRIKPHVLGCLLRDWRSSWRGLKERGGKHRTPSAGSDCSQSLSPLTCHSVWAFHLLYDKICEEWATRCLFDYSISVSLWWQSMCFINFLTKSRQYWAKVRVSSGAVSCCLLARNGIEILCHVSNHEGFDQLEIGQGSTEYSHEPAV